jgi:hypothetical protein
MASKPSLYDNLLEISQGKLDVFTDATNDFVQTSENTNISFEETEQGPISFEDIEPAVASDSTVKSSSDE